MKCINCGAELTDDTKFCSYCGAKITASELPKDEPKEEKTIEPQADEVDEDIYEEEDVEEEYEEPVTSPKAQKAKPVATAKSTLGDKAKSKFKEFWNGLSVFGKLSTVSIALAALLCLIAFLAGRIFAGIIAVVWIAVGVVAILMKKNVIKVPKTWIPLLAIILSFILIVPYFSLFKVNIADYEKYNWDEVVMADMLPTPESPYGEIISNSENYLAVYVTKTTQDEYSRYIEACKEKGFTIDTETTGSFFYAYNEQGYKLSLSYYDYNSEMHISLSAGTELGTLEWPNSKLAKMLPTPETTVGNIQKDDEKGFSAYLGDTTIDAFNAYVTACKDKGFTVDVNSTDKHFSAKNADGYKLSVEYQGNNVVYVSLAEPEYSVTIEVECVENLIFSKYDVDVYVDDSFEGTITHGDTETFELTLTKGTYTLKFVSDEDDEKDGEVTLHIYQNENLKYKISCNSSGVDVETIKGTTPQKPNENNDTTTDYKLDYADAESFETALNNGEKVNGKIVQFVVNEYKPDSSLGINCWAGEHLNFISEKSVNVSSGDIIIGHVTAEPSKVLGSWKIPYEVLSINDVASETSKPTESDKEDNTETTTPPTNTASAPDDWTNLLEKHYEEVKKQFEDAGFTNITCVAHEIDFNENNVFEGSVVNIAIGENGEICTFEKGEQWDKNIKIRIDYRVKPAKPASEYEKAYIRDMSNYDLYYMFDTDKKTVVYFGTNDTYIEKGTYTGDFSTGVTITWSHGEWTEKFTHKSGNTATLIDGNGWDWEYKVCDVEKAQNILDGLK